MSNAGGFPGGANGKESSCQSRRHGFDPWVGKIPWRSKWQPTPVFLPGKFHGQRSLRGYSPRGPKESDTTDQPSTHLSAFAAVKFAQQTPQIRSLHLWARQSNDKPAKECGMANSNTRVTGANGAGRHLTERRVWRPLPL